MSHVTEMGVLFMIIQSNLKEGGELIKYGPTWIRESRSPKFAYDDPIGCFVLFVSLWLEESAPVSRSAIFDRPRVKERHPVKQMVVTSLSKFEEAFK